MRLSHATKYGHNVLNVDLSPTPITQLHPQSDDTFFCNDVISGNVGWKTNNKCDWVITYFHVSRPHRFNVFIFSLLLCPGDGSTGSWHTGHPWPYPQHGALPPPPHASHLPRPAPAHLLTPTPAPRGSPDHPHIRGCSTGDADSAARGQQQVIAIKYRIADKPTQPTGQDIRREWGPWETAQVRRIHVLVHL